MLNKAKTIIHKFIFDKDRMLSGDKVHVALVDNAANLTEVVSMKSKVISYEVKDTEKSPEAVQRMVEEVHQEIDELEEDVGEVKEDLVTIAEVLESVKNEGETQAIVESDLEDIQKSEASNTDAISEDTVKSNEEIIVEDVLVDAEKSQQEELDSLKAQLAELDALKAAKAELDALKATVHAKKVEEYTDLVKGFSAFEGEAEVADVVKGLMEMSPELAKVFIEGFERQANTLKSFATQEHGTDLSDASKECRLTLDSAVNDILKSRKRGA